MKKIKIYAFSLLSILAISSCNLLDQLSPNDIDAADAIKDANSAEAALLGIYSSLQPQSYYGGNYVLISEPLVKDATTGGYQFLSLDQLSEQNVTPSNIIITEMWTAIYRTISNSNHLLTALPNVSDLTAERKAEIEGQARAIRAMAHFDLLRYFGEHWNVSSVYGVPLIKTVQTITDQPTRATVGEVYDFVISELIAAMPLVSQTDKSQQFMTKNAINALLARVNLYKKNYTQAALHANNVIASGEYNLFNAADFGSLYSIRRNQESIFELSYEAQNRSAFNSLTYTRDAAARSELWFIVSQDLGNFLNSRAGDVRTSTVDMLAANNDATIAPDGRSQKYRGEDIKNQPAYILRLAEMYLISAEAKGRTTGLTDLNALRVKRGLAALTAADVNTDDKYIAEILKERRAEFNFEGHRYFDLARLQKYESVTGAEAFHAICPIPSREIAANPNIVQNPGY